MTTQENFEENAQPGAGSLLTIQECELIDPVDYAIRFTGPSVSFHAMIRDLKAEGYQFARWDREVFNERGGWIVDIDNLYQFFRKRFTNLEHSIERAKVRAYQPHTKANEDALN